MVCFSQIGRVISDAVIADAQVLGEVQDKLIAKAKSIETSNLLLAGDQFIDRLLDTAEIETTISLIYYYYGLHGDEILYIIVSQEKKEHYYQAAIDINEWFYAGSSQKKTEIDSVTSGIVGLCNNSVGENLLCYLKLTPEGANEIMVNNNPYSYQIDIITKIIQGFLAPTNN